MNCEHGLEPGRCALCVVLAQAPGLGRHRPAHDFLKPRTVKRLVKELADQRRGQWRDYRLPNC